MTTRALESDFDHPLMDLLANPNPHQNGNQLMTLTYLWMAVRGEVFWVLESESGGPLSPGELPGRIWPLSPDLFEPIFEDGSQGDIVGWWFCPPRYMRKGSFANIRIPLPVNDVVQYKTPNPMDPTRGLSRISAAALTIETDLMAKVYNRAILENGGDPGGVLTYDGTLKKEEEEEYLEQWEAQHQGSHNARRTALLQGGFKYTPVALAPKDIEYLKLLDWDREEILAVMATSSSVLGAKDVANYAVAQAQDGHFWDKNIIPMLVNVETTFDATMLFDFPDDIVGIHDLKDIEALRSGVSDKVNIANAMCGQNLHVPPSVAFATVGLEVESYDGDDQALLPPIVVPAKEVFNPEIFPLLAPAPAPAPAPAGDFDAMFLARKIRTIKANRWKDFIKVQVVIEDAMKRKYRGWIGEEKRKILDWFDGKTAGRSFVSAITKQVDLVAVLPPVENSQNALKGKFRPLYASALEETFDFTLDDIGGVPVFDLSEPRIVQFFNSRERTFVNATPRTIRKSLVQTLSEGLVQGETIQQLRIRVAQVYDIAASSSKALQVARTESASFMNGVRDVIFEAQGFTKEEWSTAQDEHVRLSHQVYGDAGPLPREFNYLELMGNEAAGILTFPGDTRCQDPSELINCRCLMIPVE